MPDGGCSTQTTWRAQELAKHRLAEIQGVKMVGKPIRDEKRVSPPGFFNLEIKSLCSFLGPLYTDITSGAQTPSVAVSSGVKIVTVQTL